MWVSERGDWKWAEAAVKSASYRKLEVFLSLSMWNVAAALELLRTVVVEGETGGTASVEPWRMKIQTFSSQTFTIFVTSWMLSWSAASWLSVKTSTPDGLISQANCKWADCNYDQLINISSTYYHYDTYRHGLWIQLHSPYLLVTKSQQSHKWILLFHFTFNNFNF